MIALKTIVVATDFSAPSNTAVLYGLNFARTFGAKVHLLNVVDDVAVYATALGDFGAFQTRLEDDARERLAALMTDADRANVEVESTVLTSSAMAYTVIGFARDVRADLIIVGTHGRTGLSHLAFGSVAEKVVRLADCPVLTVRTKEREFVKPDVVEVGQTCAVR